jgi:hypothetical protein
MEFNVQRYSSSAQPSRRTIVAAGLRAHCSGSLVKRPRHILMMAFVLGLAAHEALAQAPSWWTERGVLVPGAAAKDHAAINSGQAKNLAASAYAEMQEHLPGGAGSEVSNLVAGFSQVNNGDAVNAGQLKNLALPFYDRLRAVLYTNAYPWTTDTSDDKSHSLANIGQAKNLFSFDVGLDSDVDGLVDWWECKWFGGLTAQASSGDVDSDGLANGQEFWAMGNPTGIDTDGDGLGDWTESRISTNAVGTASGYNRLPFADGFELPLLEGDLAGQNGWLSSRAGAAVIQKADDNTGKNAAELVANTGNVSSAWQYLGSIQGGVFPPVVWVDFSARIDSMAVLSPESTPSIAACPADLPCLFVVSRNGYVAGYDGASGTWLTNTTVMVAPDRYRRYSAKENFATRTWDLYIDNMLVLSNLSFRTGATVGPEFSRLVAVGTRGAGFFIDDVGVTTNRPEGAITNRLGESGWYGAITTGQWFSVSLTNDDAAERTNGTVNISSNRLALGTNAVGLRFANVKVPAGSAVVRAYVQFVSGAMNTNTCKIDIKCETNGNALAFVASTSNIMGRTCSDETVKWDVEQWLANTTNSVQRTPELSSVVQEAFYSQGWTTNSALVIRFKQGKNGENGVRSPYSRDAGTNQVPKLYLEWAPPIP